MAHRAKRSFITRVDGRKRFVSEGEFVKSSDPIVKARAELFEDLEGTETTRSRPKRNTKRTTTKKSEPQSGDSEESKDES